MKGYGLPRDNDVEFPDIVDVHYFGLNTSSGGKDYFKNKSSKRSIRRYWKRKARKENEIIIKEELNELDLPSL